jgi:hypothetical protein
MSLANNKFDYTTLLTLPVNLALGPYSSFVTGEIQCHTPYYIETLSSAEYRKGMNSTGYFAFPNFFAVYIYIYKAGLYATCTKFFCSSLLLKLESERRRGRCSRYIHPFLTGIVNSCSGFSCIVVAIHQLFVFLRYSDQPRVVLWPPSLCTYWAFCTFSTGISTSAVILWEWFFVCGALLSGISLLHHGRKCRILALSLICLLFAAEQAFRESAVV